MNLHHKVILLVEDNSRDAARFERALRAEGFQNPLWVVTSAEEAKTFVRAEKCAGTAESSSLPQLIVVNVDLPKGGGWDFLHWVRCTGGDYWRPAVMIMGGTDRLA